MNTNSNPRAVETAYRKFCFVKKLRKWVQGDEEILCHIGSGDFGANDEVDRSKSGFGLAERRCPKIPKAQATKPKPISKPKRGEKSKTSLLQGRSIDPG